MKELFELRYGKMEQPLFKGISDLAEAITEAEDSPLKEKKIGSVQSYLRQVFKPRTAREHRPLSDGLRTAIHIVVKKRLGDPKDALAAIEKIDAAFKELATQKPYQDLASTAKTFERMLKASDMAHEQVIFTFQPAEAVENDLSAERLRKELLERIGLIHTEGEPTKTKCKYRFFVDRVYVAQKIWENIFCAASATLGQSIADERLAEIDREELLTVCVVDTHHCVFPCVVFNPNAATSTGFVLFYEPNSAQQEKAGDEQIDGELVRGQISIAQMNSDAIALWKRSVYENVANTILSGNQKERVRWNHVRDMCFRK